MAISLDEKLVTLTEASKILPGRPHISSLWRWHRRGVRGVRLETLVVAGRRFTSLESLERFTAATTAAADGQPMPTRTSKQREKAIAAAEAELAREGIGNSLKVKE
jgi:hypothetical protein